MDFNGEVGPFILQWTVSSIIMMLFALFFLRRIRIQKQPNEITYLFLASTGMAAIAAGFISFPFFFTTNDEILNVFFGIGLLFVRLVQLISAYIVYRFGPWSKKLKATLFFSWIPFLLASFINDFFVLESTGVIQPDGSYGWSGSLFAASLLAVSSLPFAPLGLTIIKLAPPDATLAVKISYILFGVFLIIVAGFTVVELVATQAYGAPEFQIARTIATVATGATSVVIIFFNQAKKKAKISSEQS